MSTGKRPLGLLICDQENQASRSMQRILTNHAAHVSVLRPASCSSISLHQLIASFFFASRSDIQQSIDDPLLYPLATLAANPSPQSPHIAIMSSQPLLQTAPGTHPLLEASRVPTTSNTDPISSQASASPCPLVSSPRSSSPTSVLSSVGLTLPSSWAVSPSVSSTSVTRSVRSLLVCSPWSPWPP